MLSEKLGIRGRVGGGRGSQCYRELCAAGFKSYRERLSQPGRKSGAMAAKAYDMSGNRAAHKPK